MTRHSSFKRNYHSLWSKYIRLIWLKELNSLKVVTYKLSLKKKYKLRLISTISNLVWVTCIVDILVHLFDQQIISSYENIL